MTRDHDRTSVKEKYELFLLLKEHIRPSKDHPELVEYINGMTDRKLAELSGVSVHSVSYNRHAVFGNLAAKNSPIVAVNMRYTRIEQRLSDIEKFLASVDPTWREPK